MLDTILKNGLVYDGLAGVPYIADIAIKDDKIVEIKANITTPAKKIEHVDGYWVCPGFIDIHTHYDAEIELNPVLYQSVRHGVTSVVMGNCSMSLNIGSPEINAHLFQRVETINELVSNWSTIAKKWPNSKSYFEYLNTLNITPNVALLTGHSAIRAEVMGLQRSLFDIASNSEIKSMISLAREALDAGSIGISIDMVHWHRVTGPYVGRALPSHHANYKEYAALAAVCRERDAVFQLTPDPKCIWTSVYNIFKLSHGIARAPLRCTVLSAMDMSIDRRAWRAATSFASICNNLFSANIRFQTLPQPFTIYSDGPITPLFEEFESGFLLNNIESRAERVKLWQRQSFKQKFKQDWLNYQGRTFEGDFDHIYIVSAHDKTWHNKSVAEVARYYKQNALDFFCDLLEKYDTDFRWKHTGANTRDHILAKLVKHPYVLPGFSDAGAHCKNMAYFDSAVTLLKQCVQKNWMPVEQAISRVTYEPAKWFNLGNIGSLKINNKADIVILDPEKLKLPISIPELAKDQDISNLERMVNHYTPDTSPIKASYISGKRVIKNGELDILNKSGRVVKLTTDSLNTKQSYNRYRNRINNLIIDHPLKSYWDIFILKHTDDRNVKLHLTAFILMYVIFFTAFFSMNPWVFLLMPISQLTGFLGHYFYESSAVDKRDLVFSWRAFFCLHKLFYYRLTNRYHKELARVQAIINNY